MMREFCFKHQVLRLAGAQCGQCAIEASAPALDDTLNVLEARIADQDGVISYLHRLINALEHRMNDLQRAHNRSVT